jgi:hypothetical protein
LIQGGSYVEVRREAFESINVLTFNLLQFDILVRGGLAAGNT